MLRANHCPLTHYGDLFDGKAANAVAFSAHKGASGLLFRWLNIYLHLRPDEPQATVSSWLRFFVPIMLQDCYFLALRGNEFPFMARK